MANQPNRIINLAGAQDGDVINIPPAQPHLIINADVIRDPRFRAGIDNVIAVGNGYDFFKGNAVSIGHNTVVNHKNTVLIGNNVSTKHDNSVLIKSTEFTDDKISVCDDKLSIYGNNTDATVSCNVCNFAITSGIGWNYDEKIHLKLCFQCIYDTILRIHSQDKWVSHTSGESLQPYNSKYEVELLHLKNQIALLEDQITCIRQVFKNL